MIQVKDLRKYFNVQIGILRKEVVRAVDGISFHIERGEVLGLVGESGSGKTTVGKCILRLEEPTSGEVFFNDISISGLDEKRLREMRRNMQMVFQDPSSSLDPRMKVRDAVAEPLRIHKQAKGKELEERVLSLLQSVGLGHEHLNRHPHMLSGGQRQRVVIARTLALNPKLLVLDEPTSALDVSVQAQILNLLRDLQKRLDISMLLISHDLSIIRHLGDRIAVMYSGKIVELADEERLFDNAMHPYTQALLSAIPTPEFGPKKERIVLRGEIPNPINPPHGCRFHPRCPHAMQRCAKEEPKLTNIDNEHYVACFLHSEKSQAYPNSPLCSITTSAA